ncbi:MAG: nucleoside-diphosphate kinase [Candidatus Diapherotrites archaeon]
MQRTLVIVKPDGVNRGLIGDITGIFERKGLKIVAMKMEKLKQSQLEKHYSQHSSKPFFKQLVGFMSSIPSVLLVLEGKEAVKVVRKMVGATNGREAEPNTIRGLYSMSTQSNLIHASESKEMADKEITLFFSDKELHEYQKMDCFWIYSPEELNEKK